MGADSDPRSESDRGCEGRALIPGIIGNLYILAYDLALPAIDRPTGQGGVLSPMPSPQRVRTPVPLRITIQRTENPDDGGDFTFHDILDQLSPSPSGS